MSDNKYTNKSWGFVLGLILMTAMIQGCAKKQDNSTSVKSSRKAGSPYSYAQSTSGKAPTVGTLDQYTGRSWQAMTPANITTQNFNNSVQMFVSASMNPQDLGTVSSTSNAATGIRFLGALSTTSPISTTGYNYTQITQNSFFYLGIFDSYAGMYDQNGQMVPEYGDYYPGDAIWGYVSGTYVELHFNKANAFDNSGSYREIIIRGDIIGTTFRGYLSFNNNQYWDGAAPGAAASDVWTFSVPTCAFFYCQ